MISTIAPAPLRLVGGVLLAAIDDVDRVVLVLEEQDLRDLIAVLQSKRRRGPNERRLLEGFQNLLGAFVGDISHG